jgi:hypothetical protein
VTAKIDPSAAEAVIVSRDVRLIDQYPYGFQQVWTKLKAAVPNLKQHRLQAFIRGHKIKDNPRYAAYSYPSKQAETKGPRPGTAVIYNEDFLRFALQELAAK